MKNKRIATLAGAVVAPLVLGFQAQAADVSVLGDLEVRGSAQVRAEESGAPVRLSDTSYAYVSGERIRTRDDASAVLRLDGGDRLALGPQTRARIEGEAGRYSVDLSEGSLAYSVSPDSALTIDAGGSTLEPVGDAIKPVSSGDEQRITGWVSVDESGKVNVSARSGDMEVTRGGSTRVVSAGESVSIDGTSGELIAAQVQGATEGGEARAVIGPFGLSGGELLTLVGTSVVVTAGGNEVLVDDDDGDDLASP